VNKIVIVFMMFIVILGAVVAIPYGAQFGFQLSEKSDEWANFATYFSGIVSPIVAAVTLFGFWLTINQQSTQLVESKRQTNISLLENTISKIESDFVSLLKDKKITLYLGDKEATYSYLEVLMSPLFPCWESVIPKVESISLPEKYSLSDAMAYESFIMAAGNLNQLRIYVDKHAQVSGTNTQSKYYARKYETAYIRLKKAGYWSDGERWIMA